MKIYTKTGDQGETGMLGGVRISKSSIAIEVTGGLDETNSLLGVIGSQLPEQLTAETPSLAAITNKLHQIQNDLFDLGSRVSACLSESGRAVEFLPARGQVLERWIDELQADLPELMAFILPGGCMAGSFLHQARAVCRRTERDLVALMTADLDWPTPSKSDQRLSTELVYMNRLSDLLFVMARYVNHQLGSPEIQWRPTSNNA